MNDNQKLLTVAACGAIVLSLCFSPWEVTRSMDFGANGINLGTVTMDYKTSPIWNPPRTSGQPVFERDRLRTETLLIEWAAMGLIYVGLLAALRDGKKAKSDSN